ncbi:hypothetical protein PG985_001516 [Apiospora marii]|uniref:uncharacterized protein n=1 Tax=Apiospora marii TaxID=335849 RepID=UPI00312D022E
MASHFNDAKSQSSSASLSKEALAALEQDLAAEDPTGGPAVLIERYLKLHRAQSNAQNKTQDKLYELHNDTTKRLKKVERQLRKVASSVSTSTKPSTISELSYLEDDYELGYEENTIPETRDTNFELFKNRYGDHEGKNCIEVLIAGSDFDEQVRQELGRRGELDEDNHKRRVDPDEMDEVIIQRVRIQSPALLFLLCKALDHPDLEWKGHNRTTFYRPFAMFSHVHNKMRDQCTEIEDYWFPRSSTSNNLTEEMQMETVEGTIARLRQADPEGTAKEAVPVSENPELGSVTSDESNKPRKISLARRTERSLLQKALLENYHTLLELRCYLDFVEKRILPSTRRYEDAKKPEARKIRYQDLWFLFPPGELLVAKRFPSMPVFGGFDKDELQIGRCYRREKPDATATSGWTQPSYLACQSRKPKCTFEQFCVGMYGIDFHGENYGRSERFILIPFFEGLQEVTSLPIYPLRFHKDQEELRRSFSERGSMFKDAIELRHMAYRGWSRKWFPRSSRGPPGPGPGLSAQQQQQLVSTPTVVHNSTYIESDVIVDVSEAYRAAQSTASPFPGKWVRAPELHTRQDMIEIIRWSDKKRTDEISRVQDRTQTDDAICILEASSFMDKEPLAMPQKKPEFTEEDLLLFAECLPAYALRERKFFLADVRYLHRLQTDFDAFDSLKIDPGHIRIVKAVVSSHFQRKDMENRPEFATMIDQDLIRGKGRGLVILLHGAPGVGKTATAESVALWFKQPLFVITCGDLGFTPQGVESSLGEIFRFAHLWNCVLEYYNGILFLTTNRVGTLDEAFKSRVHLSLYYPPLGRSQTEEITRMNLMRLRSIEEQRSKINDGKALYVDVDGICEFATGHWDRHTEHNGAGRWNGRQIRNAVQIAASLAWYDRKNDRNPGAEEVPPTLDERHFRIVEQTMTLFEGYMTKARGGTDTYLSEQRSERYDRFKNPEPDPFGPVGNVGNVGIGGYYPYQNRQQPVQQPGWSQQQMPSAAGPSHHHATGSPYAGPPSQQYQQKMPIHHQPHAGFSGQAQQATHLAPSLSFGSMQTDQRTHISSGNIGPQGYPQNQAPQLNPQGSYMASGAAATTERQQGISYQTGSSAPRSSQQPSEDVFGSYGASPPSMNPGGSNLSQGNVILPKTDFMEPVSLQGPVESDISHGVVDPRLAVLFFALFLKDQEYAPHHVRHRLHIASHVRLERAREGHEAVDLGDAVLVAEEVGPAHGAGGGGPGRGGEDGAGEGGGVDEVERRRHDEVGHQRLVPRVHPPQVRVQRPRQRRRLRLPRVEPPHEVDPFRRVLAGLVVDQGDEPGEDADEDAQVHGVLGIAELEAPPRGVVRRG